MKTAKFSALFLIFAFFVNIAIAQSVTEIKYKVPSATCNSCKNKIETALSKTDGVQSSSLDLKSKVVTVKYDAAKVTPEKISEAIAGSGFKPELVTGKEKNTKKGGKCCDDKKSCKEKTKCSDGKTSMNTQPSVKLCERRCL